MEPLRLVGAPHKFDVYLRPPVRIVQLLVGGGLTALLVWMGHWIWAPVPLVLSFVAYELIFWTRGDRPCTLTLTDRLRWEDPLQEQILELDPAEITVATLLYRPAAARGLVSLRVILADDRGVRLALRLQTRDPYTPAPTDLHGVFLDAIVGAGAGPMRHLAPEAETGRQFLYDPDAAGVAWLREHIPAEAWERVGIRVWRGAKPELDRMSTHKGASSGWLVLDGGTARLRRGLHRQEHAIALGPGGQAERKTILTTQEGDQVVMVPLAVVDLAEELVLCAPSPLLGTLGDRRELEDGALHTHPAELELAIWHLLVHAPAESWSAVLQQAVQEASVNVEVPEAVGSGTT